MSGRDVLTYTLAKHGDRQAVAEAKKTLEMALDYAAHGPKPERMRLFPPQVRGWLGDAYAAIPLQAGTAAWQDAQDACRTSLEGWRGLLPIPNEAPARPAELERKIADCDRAILALK